VGKLIRSWGSFLAGDQSGDRTQDGVEVFASAEVTQEGAPVLQVAEAVLDTDPLRGVGLRSAWCAAATAGGTGSWFFRRGGRGVMTAPAVWVLRL
jgi:hypothetical protein